MNPKTPTGSSRPRSPRAASPPETPERESAASHRTPVPEPVELRTAWPSWVPLVAIGIAAVTFTALATAQVLTWGP
ncbi:hypothetical protein BX266_7053 [Streptomyces sp. TLI_171]|nr:hypothetical protein BX266_7053 [Streptomyces sp. TLI_171]